MKAFFTMIALCMLGVCANAQSSNELITLKGSVKDHATRLDVPGSLVEVLSAADSTVVASARADREMRSGERTWRTSDFQLILPRRKGDYLLRVTYQGYEPLYTELPLHDFYKRETSREVGALLLKRERNVALAEATVTATSVKFYHKGDTLVYNAAAFQLAEGSMLDALIRQLPGVELRAGGKIYVNGQYVESLLLNGKDFFRGDSRVLLENLPAYTVSHVSVYDRLGDDSRFLGHEAANDRKFVMDVRLKRQYNIGWTTNMEAGGGTEDRYLARLFAMRYTDHSRLSAYGNVNNLNDSRVPGEEGSWSPVRSGGGQTRQKMGGLDYNVEKRDGKYKLNGHVQASHSDNHTINRTDRTNFLAGGDTYDRVLEDYRNRSLSLSTSHRFYFEFDRANLEIKPAASYSNYDRNSSYASLTADQDLSAYGQVPLDSLFSPRPGSSHIPASLINRNLRDALASGHSWQGSLSAKSLLKFRHSPDHLTFFAEASYRNATGEQFDHNRVDYYTDGLTASTDFRNRYFDNRPDKGLGLKGKLTYTYATKRNVFIDWSYQYEHNTTDRQSSLFRLDQLRGWGEDSTHALGTLPSLVQYAEMLDAANSYDSHLASSSHAFEPFLVWSKNLENSRWNGQVAVPVSVLSRTYHYRRGATDTTFTKRHVLPSAYSTYVRWMSNDRKQAFNLHYSLSTQAPDMNLYVDIEDTTDPLSVTRGNPDLKPSYRHEISTAFTRIFRKQRLMLHFEAIFRPTQNAIAMGYVYDKATGRKTYRPENVNGNWEGTAVLGFGGSLNKKGTLNTKGYTGMAYERSVDLIGVDGAAAPARSVVGNRSFIEAVKMEYKAGQSSIGLRAEGAWSRVNGTREDFRAFCAADFNYGLTAQLSLPWKLSIGTDLTMYSRRGYADPAMNTNDLVWNARLSRPFLDGRLVVMLDGFDMLNQLSNVTRVMNAQGITETYSNVIPHYVMLHAAFRLNAAPKKN